jgi:hypothetical protein
MTPIKRIAVLAVIAVGVAVGSAAAGAPASTGSQRFFLTPGPNGASCEIDVGLPRSATTAWCVVEPPRVTAAKAIGVQLRASGRLNVCHGLRCVGNPPTRTPTLKYGRSIELGPFRCTSLRRGVRCTVTSLGHGFLLGRRGVTRV